MIARWRLLARSLVLLAVVVAARPVHADELRVGEVLRMGFDLSWYPPPHFPVPLAAFNVLMFHPGIEEIEPVSGYTVRLLDRGRVLGTYEGSLGLAYDLGYPPIASAFKSADSPFTRGNPTIVDFLSIRDGTIEGTAELTLHSGRVNVRRITDEFGLDQAYSYKDIAAQATFGAKSFEIVPTPEPTSGLLIATGAVASALWRRRRRLRDPAARPPA